MQKLIITNAGQALIAKLIAGTAEINFTKVKTSDYEYESSDIPTLTDLSQVKQTANVSSVSIVSSTIVKVRAIVNNTGLSTGYYIKSVGLYATDSSTSEEILFGVSLADEVADYIPAQSATVTGVTYTFNCKVDDTEQVDVTVNPAGVTPMEDFEELENTVSVLGSAVNNLKSKRYTLTLAMSNWTLNSTTNLYEYIITDTTVTTNHCVTIYMDISNQKKLKDGYTESFSGSYKIYTSTAPIEDIVATVVITLTEEMI